jgi:hypothetical protein
MMVRTRLWRAGAVRPHRDLTLRRQRIGRVRRCAAHGPLLGCTDGFVASVRAMRETCRDPEQTGTPGRPWLDNPGTVAFHVPPPRWTPSQ